MALSVRVTGAADIRDERWLAERIGDIDNGIEAVLDIAHNWTDGRNVSRFHPGVSAAEYLRAHVTHPLGKGIVLPLLEQSDWSNRQIAAVAGVSRNDVNELALSVPVDRPAETLGADGKYRPARVVREVTAEVIEEVAPIEGPNVNKQLWDDLLAVAEAIEQLSSTDATEVATAVPGRRRAATAKRLRTLGTYLGRIAWTLERNGESQ
jgi:hypothetical protein